MIFVYPYKTKLNHWNIEHSIKCVRKYFPNSVVVTVGDSCGFEDQNIEFKDSSIHRGVNVTGKILKAAELFPEFIYMNDDFFINDNFRVDRVGSFYEQLERKEGKASIAWNSAVDNSRSWLKFNGFSFDSYECHQPVKFNSELLLKTFDRIAWREDEHFLKSIYFNVNPPKKITLMDNVKLIEVDTKKASLFLNWFGCFSISDGFLTREGADFIRKLTL